jgi:hypothetical protein
VYEPISAFTACCRSNLHVYAPFGVVADACINAAAFAHADAFDAVRFIVVDLNQVAIAILEEDNGLVMTLELLNRSWANCDTRKSGGVFYANLKFAIDIADIDRAYITFTGEYVLCVRDVRRGEHHQREERPHKQPRSQKILSSSHMGSYV